MNDTNNQNPSQRSDMSSLYPSVEGFKPNQQVAVGGVITKEANIEYNTDRKTVKCVVTNTGDRPIQVGSHFHFFEVNRYLEFDRNAAFGCHLNIPATTAIRFEPGDRKEVELVAFSGKRRIIGFNGLVMGYTGEEEHPSYLPLRNRSLRRALRAGFLNAAENSSAVEERHLNNNNKN